MIIILLILSVAFAIWFYKNEWENSLVTAAAFAVLMTIIGVGFLIDTSSINPNSECIATLEEENQIIYSDYNDIIEKCSEHKLVETYFENKKAIRELQEDIETATIEKWWLYFGR
jgi:sugar phosphate permease